MTAESDRTAEFARYLRTETFGGIVLIVAAAIALVWANSPVGDSYRSLFDWTFGPEPLHLHLSLGGWIRDGLLAVFFLVVGLELKRELVVGELANVRAAAFPIAAAFGGIIVPALLAASIMWGEAGAARAWAIPTATDIAFALGVLALVGSALPPAVRLVLLALAVVDDLVAIVLIAVLFSDGISWIPLAGAVVACGLWALLQRSRVRGWYFYVPIALAAWGLLHASGVHATIAGVALGLLTRVRPDAHEDEAPAVRLEHALQPWSAAVVVPLFALAAAGVSVAPDALRDVILQPVPLGVLVGLVVGKLVGIVGAAWLVERLGLAARPVGMTWGMVTSIALLAGVGFTVSLLVADLALAGEVAERAKAAVLLASLAAATLATICLRWQARSAD